MKAALCVLAIVLAGCAPGAVEWAPDVETRVRVDDSCGELERAAVEAATWEWRWGLALGRPWLELERGPSAAGAINVSCTGTDEHAGEANCSGDRCTITLELGALRAHAETDWLDPEGAYVDALEVAAVHELGHALGVKHSADPSSYMATNTDAYRALHLTDEDLAQARATLEVAP